MRMGAISIWLIDGSPTFDEHREALHLASERPGGEASLSRLNELRKRIERE